jgi:zinc protease
MRFLWVLMLLVPGVAWAAPVQEVVSKSGVKAWLVEEHGLPLVSAKLLFVDAGTAYDPAGKEGRAKLAVGLLDEGAGEMDATAFSEALEEKAIRLSFGVDEDGVTAAMTVLSEFAPDGFRLMGLALGKPKLDEAAVTRVRGQMMTVLIQQEKDPGYVLQQRWRDVVFGGHAYSQPEWGTKESVKHLGRGDVVDYLRRYVARDNVRVAVVGDVTPAQLKEWLDAGLGGLPAKAQREVTLKDVALPAKAQQVVVENDVPQTVIAFGTQGVARKDPDFYDAYVMNHLLGGGTLTSLLSDEIREKRGLAYGISTALQPMRHAALWAGGFATKNDRAGEGVAALRQVMQDFAAKGPDEKQLAEAKQYITGAFVLGLDSNMDVASYLITMQQNDLGRDYLEKRNGLMNAVTREGVMKAAKKIVNTDGLQVVLVGKPVLEVKK